MAALRKQAAQSALDYALGYAAEGWPVFPCNPATDTPDSKSPYTSNGFYAATTDELQIRRWWTQWPAAMIGVPTGTKSGMWVLDLDNKKPGKNGFAELGLLEAKHDALP